ncbi:hypothetical protein SAMN04488029_2130 [Reichenbachiella faecimaris]|uniref:CAAX prenyl protease 2/Lysostaphin resistance protein A-like domain-containing protein n=1 Tax=Reichenbachiella faecimaris TaxID=692418 RepID=A0A1W2GDD9_REIFA|nr:type II CAAX endopeptidase family protein [Reichenbachiella faecimaris]SMD34677.1 hypothetical protein SAMN04488029_2130 [Reichenbachiella faecimaris]
MKKKIPLWLRITLILILTVIVLVLSEIIRELFDNALLGTMLSNLIAAFCLFGLVYWFRLKLDKQSIKTIGIDFSYKHSLTGGFIATLVLGIGLLSLLLSGQVSIINTQFNLTSLILSLLSFLFVGFFEELVFRGYIQTNLSQNVGDKWALILSSFLFAFLHSLNPDISLLALFNIFLVGILLGKLYQISDNLWLVISLHTLWNFLQGPVFGFAVSGNDSYSLLTLKEVGAEYLTGGQFGFEGSLSCTFITVTTIALITTKRARTLLT